MPEPVRAAFEAWPLEAQAVAMRLRQMIFETAEETATGPLTETLKWGQPAYLTEATKAGTTIRLGYVDGQELPCRLYVHCGTSLVAQFRDVDDGALVFEGNRAVCLPETGELPEAPLRHCMAMALTYHRKSGARRG